MNKNNKPIARFFNGKTGKYDFFIDDFFIDAYGNINKEYCVIEYFTGVYDKNNIPLFENDLILPTIGNIRQYRRIWRTIGGFILSDPNNISSLSTLITKGSDCLVHGNIQHYISNYCEKVGCANLNPEKLNGRSKEEMIRDLIRMQ